ncbi:MAG TPA: hypothetical protein VGC27_12395 [Rhizomicrobium sp.]
MDDTRRQPTPATPPPLPSPDAVLAEQLARCHGAIAGCFEFCGDGNVPVSQQLETLNIASRLMRVSVVLAKALDKSPKEFIHRIIVERPAMIDVTPATAIPPTPAEKVENNLARKVASDEGVTE